MYLSVNFRQYPGSLPNQICSDTSQRWPMLGMAGNIGQNCANPNIPSSAFKHSVASSAGCPESLLPVATSCSKETNPMLEHHLAPSSSSVTLAHPSQTPTHHHHHHHQAQPHSTQPMCPPYPHAQPVEERLPAPILTMKDNPSNLSGGAPASNMAHPAFPMSMPMWLQHSQSYNISHLQQVLNHEKALLASQYLADPFAKGPFLDLARMGHYPLGKKLFGCPQCRYITDRKNNLKRHIATMHQECDKALECCGVVFKNKASLRDHVLIFHSNGYMCRFCGRNFCRKALLKRHLTVHSGQKDYICTLCDYATSHKSNLERHKKVHERQSTDSDDPNTGSQCPGTDSLKEKTNEKQYIPGCSRDLNALDEDEMQLSPINVEDDPNSLINVVDLPN